MHGCITSINSGCSSMLLLVLLTDMTVITHQPAVMQQGGHDASMHSNKMMPNSNWQHTKACRGLLSAWQD